MRRFAPVSALLAGGSKESFGQTREASRVRQETGLAQAALPPTHAMRMFRESRLLVK